MDKPVSDSYLIITMRSEPLASQRDLGIQTWNYNTFSEPEVVPLRRLCGLFALAEVPLHHDGRAWVTISLDHVSVPFFLVICFTRDHSLVNTGTRDVRRRFRRRVIKISRLVSNLHAL